MKSKLKTALTKLEQKLAVKNSQHDLHDDRGLLRRMSEAALVEAIRTITKAEDEDDSEDEGNKIICDVVLNAVNFLM